MWFHHKTALCFLLVIFSSANLATAKSEQHQLPVVTAFSEMQSAWRAGDLEKTRTRLEALERLVDAQSTSIQRRDIHYWIGLGWRNYSTISGQRIEGLKSSESHLKQVVQLDPDFAEGHALLASVMRSLIGSGQRDSETIQTQAKHRQRAWEIDPINPRVMMLEAKALISIPSDRGGDINKGISTALEAIGRFELEPSNGTNWGKAECWAVVGMGYRKINQDQFARMAFNKVLEIEPDWKSIREVVIPSLDKTPQ